MSHLQVVQATSQLYDKVVKIAFPIPQHIFDNPTAFNTSNDNLSNSTS